MADESETRVLLVKPGDVLLIGHLGDSVRPESLGAALADFRKQTGINVYAFTADIDIAKVPGE
jgi:hypothetical protein